MYSSSPDFLNNVKTDILNLYKQVKKCRALRMKSSLQQNTTTFFIFCLCFWLSLSARLNHIVISPFHSPCADKNSCQRQRQHNLCAYRLVKTCWQKLQHMQQIVSCNCYTQKTTTATATATTHAYSCVFWPLEATLFAPVSMLLLLTWRWSYAATHSPACPPALGLFISSFMP